MSLASRLGVLRLEHAIRATYKVYRPFSDSRVCLGAEEGLSCESVQEVTFVDDPDSVTSAFYVRFGLSQS